jgi:hypothetical protein
MGQYWKVVNLDKHETICPHKVGSGIKLWEILANPPGVGAALVILCAAMPEARGGGDFDLDQNWHGPERTFPEHNAAPGPMPDDYPVIAARTIGRWAGDRIALIGDYAEDGDLAPEHAASTLYERSDKWTDVSSDVREVIAHELDGSWHDTGYGSLIYQEKPHHVP